MPEDQNKPPVELRTENVNEILGHIPNWIVRWGTLTFLFVLFIILFGAYIFEYPHIVQAKIKVTTENPPSNAIAKTNGRITQLFVKDNDQVEAGAVLAIIENPANYEDVFLVSDIMQVLEVGMRNPDSILTINLPTYVRLGSVQTEYSSFLKQLEDIRNFISLDYHNQKINSFEKEIERFGAYSWTLKKQSKILENERILAQKQYSRDSSLFRQGVIPEAEIEKSKSALLQKQRAYEESRSLLVNTDISISRLEQQILDLKLQESIDLSKHQIAVQEAYDNLAAAIGNWDQQYVLRTNVGGTVSFTKIWSENQNVVAGDLVMTVIPENSGEIIGKLDLAIQGSGKVANDQDVNVKFDNFPFLEYGIVQGKIKSISLVTNDNAYSVLVEFPHGLETNYGNTINFTQDMQGIAEIITNDESLLERIINPVKSVLKRQRDLREKV
ncbi:MAG: HlyD family secretion protein [Bacteroidales bacterium]|nr:HlyD family secretion protein [Bacteroidales bacterium]MCF8392149.1 HlyD family secretion protein [Bacteroidales bacterium]